MVGYKCVFWKKPSRLHDCDEVGLSSKRERTTRHGRERPGGGVDTVGRDGALVAEVALVRHVGKCARRVERDGCGLDASRERTARDFGQGPGGGIDVVGRDGSIVACIPRVLVRHIGEAACVVDGDGDRGFSSSERTARDFGQGPGGGIDAIDRDAPWAVEVDQARHIDEPACRVERDGFWDSSRGERTAQHRRKRAGGGIDTIGRDVAADTVRHIGKAACGMDRDGIGVLSCCEWTAMDLSERPGASIDAVDPDAADFAWESRRHISKCACRVDRDGCRVRS